MPHVYPQYRNLIRTALIENGSCVSLIRKYTPGLITPSTAAWRPGKPVLGATDIAPGTAIATFIDGRYPNKPTGNHAAWFSASAGAGIWVVDQWPNDPKRPWVELRIIYPKRMLPGGVLPSLSNIAEAFYVIELK
jgi:hypothetical protein